MATFEARNISEELKADIDSLKADLQALKGKEPKVKYEDVLLFLYKNYLDSKAKKITLTDEESDIVSKALEVSGMSYQELMTRGLVAQSKGIVSNLKNTAKLKDLPTSQLKSGTFRGVAEERLERALSAVLAHNNGCTDIEDKWFITKTLMKSWVNSNYPALTKFWDEHQSEIDAHHEKHGLTKEHGSKHNRGKDIAASIPY